MILRLPLDYENLYAGWLKLISNNNDLKTMLPNVLPYPIWQSKIHLMKNIIAANPDTRFCDRCQQCCLEFPFACRPVEFFYILQHIALTWSESQQSDFFVNQLGFLKEDGSNYCPFLMSDGCSIYQARPLLCRRAISGDHICNKLSREFDSFGEWCNHSEVINRLTTMNLVYYYFDEQNRSVELSWPVETRTGGSLTLAPFEIWLLLLLKEQECCERIMLMENYKPLIKWYSY